MTNTPNIEYSHSKPLWASIFLDTLVLSDGRVLAEGVYGPEHLRQALADHQLHPVDDIDELLDGTVDALTVRPLSHSADSR